MAEWVALRMMFKLCARETGYKGEGKVPGAVVDTGVSGETSENQVKRHFGGNKGVVATGIRKTWKERGRGGGGGY